MREIIITENEAGQRFDKMLAKYLKEAPKSFLYKMLRKKNIVLNGKKATGNEKLQLQDSVKLFLSEETIQKFSGEELRIVDSSVQLDVIYEDHDVIFLNKPVGMLSQKAKDTDVSINEHLISYLVKKGQITTEELKTFRPSICNRLDRNTSGLIVAGKSLLGLQTMNELFKNRTLEKYYLCLVKGVVTEAQKIEGYLVKDERTNKVQITKEKPVNAASKSDSENVNSIDVIQTEYRPLTTGKDVSLLEVHLITGKTHQIRAHLASIGHPIIGDYKYGQKNVNDLYKEKYGLKSQFLHSYRLVLPDLSDTLPAISKKEYKAELPKLFQKICTDMGVR